MGGGINKDGSKEAYRKNFRRMLHEGGAEGGAGGEGRVQGRGVILFISPLVSRTLVSRPLFVTDL